MTEAQEKELRAMRKAYDVFVGKISGNPAEINENMVAIRPWKPGKYALGDVRMYYGVPYKCVQAHESTITNDWTPEDTPALWMQYHGTSVETARAWIAPTGAHDMYKAGEYMIFTDTHMYLCKSDTAYSPSDYPAAWEQVTA